MRANLPRNLSCDRCCVREPQLCPWRINWNIQTESKILNSQKSAVEKSDTYILSLWSGLLEIDIIWHRQDTQYGRNKEGAPFRREIFFCSGAILGRKRELSDTGEAKECDLMAVFQNISESGLDRKYGILLSEKKVKVPQSCDPRNYTVHGILQAWILEWVAFPFSREPSQPRDRTQVSHIAGIFFNCWTTREEGSILLRYFEQNIEKTLVPQKKMVVMSDEGQTEEI